MDETETTAVVDRFIEGAAKSTSLSYAFTILDRLLEIYSTLHFSHYVILPITRVIEYLDASGTMAKLLVVKKITQDDLDDLNIVVILVPTALVSTYLENGEAYEVIQFSQLKHYGWHRSDFEFNGQRYCFVGIKFHGAFYALKLSGTHLATHTVSINYPHLPDKNHAYLSLLDEKYLQNLQNYFPSG